MFVYFFPKLTLDIKTSFTNMGRQINQVLWKTKNCQCSKCDISGNFQSCYMLSFSYTIIH